jgi:hypothetical protein
MEITPLSASPYEVVVLANAEKAVKATLKTNNPWTHLACISLSLLDLDESEGDG